MRISLIVAKSLNDVIGIQNGLPWKLKSDLQNFKSLTIGHHILMGRKTFESIGRPLPGRVSLVISGEIKESQDNLFWFDSIFKAIRHAERNGETELFIIGGAQIYKAALSFVDRIYLTEVYSTIEGDAFFPKLSEKHWTKVSEKEYVKDSENEHNFSISILDRKSF